MNLGIGIVILPWQLFTWYVGTWDCRCTPEFSSYFGTCRFTWQSVISLVVVRGVVCGTAVAGLRRFRDYIVWGGIIINWHAWQDGS